MEINTGRTKLEVFDIRCGNELTIQHLVIQSDGLRANAPLGSGACAGQLTATITITEGEVNRAVSRHAESGMRELQVALMHDHIRITGRYELMGPFAIPFVLTAIPQIVGGTTVRLEIKDLSVVGATLPGSGAQAIGERINARLASALNIERFGLPIRLTNVLVETGRLRISGAWCLEWRPGSDAVTKTAP